MEERLSQKLGIEEIKALALQANESHYDCDKLWTLVSSPYRIISVNALWVFTHMPESGKEWLRNHQSEIVEKLIDERDVAKKRMLLQILKKQEFAKDNLPLNLLDYCLSKINSECEPYAIRCFSIYVAFNICKHYPELITELEEYLEMLSYQELSPGLKSGLRQTRQDISKVKKKYRL
ncbi:MAG: hypothetical protein K2G40_09770 [Muribaculaceae bacterium]|nr:hypothetical protein [Muribaculaceae bacterium]